jgi:molybdopterin converting factor small subunit
VIVVHLPAMLRPYADGAEALTILAPISTVGELMIALERKVPALTAQLEDSVFNFAVNDEMLLHGVLEHPVKDGDRVEIVPAISGGQDSRRTRTGSTRVARRAGM